MMLALREILQELNRYRLPKCSLLPERRPTAMGGLVRLASDDKVELELTYLLHPNLWGLFFATRMAHTVMKRAFEAGLVSTIWAGADAPNKASFAVMKRLGMWFRREVSVSIGHRHGVHDVGL